MAETGSRRIVLKAMWLFIDLGPLHNFNRDWMAYPDRYNYNTDRAFGNENQVSILFSSVHIKQDLAVVGSVMVNNIFTVQRVKESKLQRITLFLQI